MKIKLDNNERQEVFVFLQTGIVPTRLVERQARDAFRKKAKKFILFEDVIDGITELTVRFKVGNAFETLFRTFGPCFILHTDNGREFVNQVLVDLCQKYEIRYVRGTKNIMGQWTKVREEVTWSYNNLRHSTTRQTPFLLMFGRPIREIMDESRITGILDSINSENHEQESEDEERAEESLSVVLNGNTNEEIQQLYALNNTNLFLNEIYHDADRIHTQTAADRMVQRGMWRNDFLEFKIGDRVLIRPYLDNNVNTRRHSLYEHLDAEIYVVTDIIQFNKVKLCREDDNGIIIDELSTRDLRLLGNE
ncbi:reverse transcriptase [Vairimorpha necatrix]|uniref:Reverse transcriptase n=1 Tax=Vairimorpha necatrix TaxID=6039 RepID=A0AAX4JBQ7_9MICR